MYRNNCQMATSGVKSHIAGNFSVYKLSGNYLQTFTNLSMSHWAGSELFGDGLPVTREQSQGNYQFLLVAYRLLYYFYSSVTVPRWIFKAESPSCKWHFCQAQVYILFLRSGCHHWEQVKNKTSSIWMKVQLWHLLRFQHLRVRGSIIHVLHVGEVSCSSCWSYVFLIASVYRSDELSLCQAWVFNPGQLPSCAAIFTAC